MRICSFLPSTTEIVYELGLGDNLVGVTHECDYPAEVKSKPRVIMNFIRPDELSSKEIDSLVTENAKNGKSTYIVKEEVLKKANPDLILTQGLCDVCAVSGSEVKEAVKVLGHTPEIISLEPNNLDEILETIIVIGEAANKKDVAEHLVSKLRYRIEKVRASIAEEIDLPRVCCIEWIDPPYIAGHWVPQMVEIAGGIDGIGKSGEPSFKVNWEEFVKFAPQIVVVMPCGFNINDTLDEIETLTSNKNWNRLPAARKGHVYLVDANSFFSRPGPRIVNGLEILAKIFHPEVCTSEILPNSVLNLRNHYYFESVLG